MGGTAFLIYGDINSKKIKPIKDRVWRKFFRRIRKQKVSIDYKSDLIKSYFVDSFVEYLNRKLRNPWNSTKHVLEYLEINEMDVFIRKDLRDSGDYIQINFFGSAGTTEISAEVACHWFEKWYEESADEIYNDINGMGFEIEEESSMNTRENIFIPTDNYGYVMMNEDPYFEGKEDEVWSRYFEIDNGIMEYYNGQDEFREYGKKLDEKYVEILEKRQCGCQMCQKSPQDI